MSKKIITIIIATVTMFVIVVATAALLLKFFTGSPLPDGQTGSLPYSLSNLQSKGGTATWTFDGAVWQPPANPPPCSEPLTLQAPVDVNLATSILYPGQMRGGAFNPHGGFRFDGLSYDQITVRVPADGLIVRGSRYLALGETQYMFDIITTCGIMHRLDHLAILSPQFANLAEQFPPPVADDSRTTDFTPPVPVKAGQVISTAVGFTKTNNTSFDWGVYDLRAVNSAAQDPTWNPQYNPEQASYAVCWLDLLSPADSVIVKNLPPGDAISGSQSDYCQGN